MSTLVRSRIASTCKKCRSYSDNADNGRFTQHYAPQVGIFNTALDPAQCLRQAPLLYWTVACIGSRKYSKNPTLLSILAPRVASEIQEAALAPEISNVQAFLFLVVWPLPIDTMGKETSSMLTALLLQAAINKGLHIRGIGQDFSRQTLTPNADLEVGRAKLWVVCVNAALKYVLENLTSSH